MITHSTFLEKVKGLKFKPLTVAFIFFWTISGCQLSHDNIKPRAIGAPDELLIVVDNKTNTGDTTSFEKLYFADEFPGLPQSEPMFRVHQIKNRLYKGHMTSYRNVLKLKTDASLKTSEINFENERWAVNQRLVEISAGNSTDLHTLLQKELVRIKRFFYEGEVFRLAREYRQLANPKFSSLLKEQFGVAVVIPPDFYVKADSSGFMWLENETRQATYGVMIYKESCGDKPMTVNDMVDMRNRLLGDRIKGSQPGSYMTTEVRVPIVADTLVVNGRKWMELRGLWRMNGDFMGGPFVSLFTEIDGQCVAIEGFIFAPGSLHKALLVPRIDAILRSVVI
jgi:hypothetical protein